MLAERAVMLVKKVTYFGVFGFLSSSCIRKGVILIFLVPQEISLRFCSKTSVADVSVGFQAIQMGTNMVSPYKSL